MGFATRLDARCKFYRFTICIFPYFRPLFIRFYGGVPFSELGLKSSDEIFPKFIVENLPTGISGLVIAGVLASAMGTLSSAISSLASSTYLDLFKTSSYGKI